MAMHSNILAWKIPWTEEPSRLQFMRSQRVRDNLVTKTNEEKEEEEGGRGGRRNSERDSETENREQNAE